VVGVSFNPLHFILSFRFLHLPQEEVHVVGRATFRILAGRSPLHLPFLPVQPLPEILAFGQLIIGGFLVLFIFDVVILMFLVGGGGHAVFDGLRVGEGVVGEFVDAVVQVSHHFAYSLPEGGVLVDKNLFGLVFEEVFDPGDVDLFAAFLIVLDLVDVEGEGLESTRAYFLLFGLYFVQAEAAEAGIESGVLSLLFDHVFFQTLAGLGGLD